MGPLHTVMLYTAPYWATLRPTELPCTLMSFTASFFLAPLYPLSYTAPSELCCTPLSCAFILLSYTLLSYTAPCWAMMLPAELASPSLLSCTLLNYWLCCTFWAMLHLTEPWGTLLSYTAPNWATLYSLSCAAPYWAREHPAEIHSTPYELAHHDWAMLHPTELRWRLLSFAEPDWATLCSRELLCSLLSYASPCELHYSLTELPSVLVPLCNFVKCRNAGLSGTGISVPQSGTGMLRYRTEMLFVFILQETEFRNRKNARLWQIFSYEMQHAHAWHVSNI
jgi:hypothetical protein